MSGERRILRENPISCFADEIGSSVEKQLALLKELGIKWIEFRSGDGKGVAEYTCQEAEVLWERLQKEGTGISAVGSPIGKIDITEDFEPHFKVFTHVARLAEIWQTPYIRCFSFYLPQAEDDAEQKKTASRYRDEVMRRTARMVEYAQKKNLVLLHENEKGIYGDVAARCLDLLQEFDCASYQCTFDFANFVQCGQDTMEAYGLLKERIAYVHVKDAKKSCGTVVPAGQGDGNVKKILSLLDGDGYQGYLSLEPHLADFAGLQGLEKETKKRGRSDTEQAFVTAYEALAELLA